jgi:hypothetical protein
MSGEFRGLGAWRAYLARLRAVSHCMSCGKPVNPLLHIAYPQLCKNRRPPLGGWPEPHKDDL